MANTMVGSRWRQVLSRTLATTVGGWVMAVLAGGAARGCSEGHGAPFPFRLLAGDRDK